MTLPIGTILAGSPGVETASEPWRTKKKERQGEPISNRGSPFSRWTARTISSGGGSSWLMSRGNTRSKVQSVITLNFRIRPGSLAKYIVLHIHHAKKPLKWNPNTSATAARSPMRRADPCSGTQKAAADVS